MSERCVTVQPLLYGTPVLSRTVIDGRIFVQRGHGRQARRRGDVRTFNRTIRVMSDNPINPIDYRIPDKMTAAWSRERRLHHLILSHALPFISPRTFIYIYLSAFYNEEIFENPLGEGTCWASGPTLTQAARQQQQQSATANAHWVRSAAPVDAQKATTQWAQPATIAAQTAAAATHPN